MESRLWRQYIFWALLIFHELPLSNSESSPWEIGSRDWWFNLDVSNHHPASIPTSKFKSKSRTRRPKVRRRKVAGNLQTAQSNSPNPNVNTFPDLPSFTPEIDREFAQLFSRYNYNPMVDFLRQSHNDRQNDLNSYFNPSWGFSTGPTFKVGPPINSKIKIPVTPSAPLNQYDFYENSNTLQRNGATPDEVSRPPAPVSSYFPLPEDPFQHDIAALVDQHYSSASKTAINPSHIEHQPQIIHFEETPIESPNEQPRNNEFNFELFKQSQEQLNIRDENSFRESRALSQALQQREKTWDFRSPSVHYFTGAKIVGEKHTVIVPPVFPTVAAALPAPVPRSLLSIGLPVHFSGVGRALPSVFPYLQPAKTPPTPVADQPYYYDVPQHYNVYHPVPRIVRVPHHIKVDAPYPQPYDAPYPRHIRIPVPVRREIPVPVPTPVEVRVHVLRPYPVPRLRPVDYPVPTPFYVNIPTYFPQPPKQNTIQLNRLLAPIRRPQIVVPVPQQVQPQLRAPVVKPQPLYPMFHPRPTYAHPVVSLMAQKFRRTSNPIPVISRFPQSIPYPKTVPYTPPQTPHQISSNHPQRVNIWAENQREQSWEQVQNENPWAIGAEKSKEARFDLFEGLESYPHEFGISKNSPATPRSITEIGYSDLTGDYEDFLDDENVYDDVDYEDKNYRTHYPNSNINKRTLRRRKNS